MYLSQVILQHILTTSLVILAGFLIGGGLGFLFAGLLRQLYRAVPGLRLPSMVLPWRTLIFGFVLFFSSPMAILMVPSLTPEQSAVLYPALVFILLVFFFVVHEALNQWNPVPPVLRRVGLARTFAVAGGVIIAIGANAAGAGILGYAQRMFSQTFRPDGYWIAWGIVMGLGLLFDLLLGIVQMLLAKGEERRVLNAEASSGID
jgi:hypothetical protein